MLEPESLTGVREIIKDHEAELSEKIGAALQHQEQLADARTAVTAAEGSLQAAQQKLDKAKQKVRKLDSKDYSRYLAIEQAAKSIAADIVTNPDIPPIQKTLYSSIYTDGGLVRQGTPDAFTAATERGKVALTAIMEQLQPGAPVLLLARRSKNIIAGIATEQTLVTTPPTVEAHAGHVTVKDGSISIVFPEAPHAISEHGLVKVSRVPAGDTLLSGHYEDDLDRLDQAASNKAWLVVGAEAITAKFDTLDPTKQLVALTALKAAGIELSVELKDKIRQTAENNLVALVAFLASGVGQETTLRTVLRRNSMGRSYHQRVPQDTPLTTVARNIDKQSMRYTAQAVGLTKEALRSKVEAALQSRIAQDTIPADQLTKDLQSLASLDNILDAVF